MEQFLSAKFLSGRNANQKIGILDSTENVKVLEVVGRAGIGTTIFDADYQLDVRGDAFIRDTLTVDKLTVTGAGSSFVDLNVTGVSTFGGNIDANAGLDVDGLSDLDELNVAGIATFASDLDVNASVDISTDLTVDGLSDLDELNVAGIATFASNIDANAGLDVDGLTNLDELNVSGLSTFASDLDVNASVDISTDLTVDGLSDLDELNVAGIATFASDLDVNASVDISTSLTVGSATTITGAGIVAGIVTGTLDNDLTLATSGTGLSGSATYNNSGAATFTVASNATDANTGGTIVARDGSGNFSAGTITADLVGDVTGDLTGVASTATKLQNARDFSITGSFVTAPAISFDGTGNVALAATITPDSIALGTYTSGDYVQSITGTTNEIEVTGGTGESSTPQIGLPDDVTITQDLQVNRDVQINRNLNVDGNITIGGTTATLFTQTLTVADADLILGVRTDGLGNDIATDNTANHGGIAIASTEGNPLVDLYVAGIETVPTTYKKIMWFKAGTFSGLGTDAWLSNYAVGIGSTQFPTGTRLAAGNVQVTENDISVVRNINASGIITGTLDNTLTLGTAGTGLSGSATYDNSGAATFTVTSNATDANTASTIVARDGSGNFSAGTITANLTGVASTATKLETARDFSVSGDVATASAVSFNGTGNVDLAVTLSNSFDANTSGIITSTGGFVGDLTGNVTGTATTATNLANGANITTGTISDDRLPDIITSNIDVTTGVSTISEVIVGSAVTINSSGINAASGIVTALQFIGTASTASFATTAYTLDGKSEGELSVGTAVTATNLAGGDAGDIPYQSAEGTTTFVDATGAGTGQVLLWNGSAPVWDSVTAASGNFGGITVQDEGVNVGTASSIGTINFVGGNIQATATTGANGISTVTLSDTPTFDSLTLESTDAGSSAAPELTLYRNSASPAPADYLGQIMFKGRNDNNADENYAKITGKILDETLGTEDGLIETAIKGNGSFVIVSRQRSDELQLLNGVGLSVDGNTTLDGNVDLGNATSDTITATGRFDSGLDPSAADTYDLGSANSWRNLNISGIATLGTVEISSGIVTAVSGVVTYYGDGQYLDGINTDLVNDTTPQLGGNLDLNGNNIDGTGNIDITGIITATSFVGDGSGITGVAGTGGLFNLVEDTTPQLGGNLDLNGYSIDGIGNINITGIITTSGDINVGNDITLYASTGIISATSYYGSGGNLEDIIGGKIGGLQVQEEGSDLGIGFTFATLNFVGPGVTATAGIGSTAIITIPGDISVDTTPQLGGDLDLNSNDITGTGNIDITGIITATSFATGAEGSAIRISSDTISGPAEIFIDPSAVGDNTGSVRIKGDLYVDGTTTQINSTTIELADFIVGIATTATTDSLADGAGIQIGPDNTLLYDHSNTSLKSSENLNLASGKTYKIDGTDVLSATTLGSGVVNSSLTSVGTLTNLNVSGVSTFQGDVRINTDDKLRFGDSGSENLQIYTNGTNSFFKQLSGDLKYELADQFIVQKDSGDEPIAVFTADGSVELYFDNSEKFETTGYGVTVYGGINASGVVTATSFVGDGSALTGVSAGTTPTENTTNQAQFIPFFVSTASTDVAGISTQSFVFNPSTTRMGIGTDSPTTALHIIGEVTATDYNSTSDARLKTNVKVIEDPLEKVQQINGVSFNWIKDNKPSMGVIADNIQEVLPELVSDSDPKTVNYNGLIGLLIECVKHQQEEINALKASINNNN